MYLTGSTVYSFFLFLACKALLICCRKDFGWKPFPLVCVSPTETSTGEDMKAQQHGEYLRKIIGQNHCLKILDWTFPVEIISWIIGAC